MNGNRHFVVNSKLMGFLFGLSACAIAYVIGVLFPCTNSDKAVATIVGFTYTLMVCSWLSIRKGGTSGGAMPALICSGAYMLLSLFESVLRFTSEFLDFFVVFPALISALMAVMIGCAPTLTAKAVVIRLSKGVVSGLVLGLGTLAVIFLIAWASYFQVSYASWFRELPYIVGGLALGCASIVYLPLISRAAGVETEASTANWLAKLTFWRTGAVLAVLMLLAGLAFSGSILK